MAEKTSKSASGQVMDVARPGKSTPSTTSKSIITGNHPLMPDPMMVTGSVSQSDSGDAETAASAITPQATRRLVIKPLTDDDDSPAEVTITAPAVAPAAKKDDSDIVPTSVETPAPAEVVAASPAPSEEPVTAAVTLIPEPASTPAVEAEPLPQPETAKVTVDTPAPATESEPTAAVKSDEPAPAADKTDMTSAASNPSKPTTKDIPKSDAEIAAAEAADNEQTAALEKLVETKQYFLPINAVEQRRSKRFVLLGIVIALLLAVAWADVALDAGLINIQGVKPVTHFFSN